MTASNIDEIRQAARADGPATILAIGTATPPNCVYQADYPDYYFRITNSEHMTQLKEKFKRMCKSFLFCQFHVACTLLASIYSFASFICLIFIFMYFIYF